MPRYITIEHILEIMDVDLQLVQALEELGVIRPKFTLDYRKVFTPLDAERIRVTQILISELGVNMEGAEVILRMREQLVQLQEILSLLSSRLEKGRRKCRDVHCFLPLCKVEGLLE